MPEILTDKQIDELEEWAKLPLTHELIFNLRHIRAENERLRAAVRNQCGDNLCWLKDEDLGKIPPRNEFLDSCRRYHTQLTVLRGELGPGQMTMAQLEAKVLELEELVRAR